MEQEKKQETFPWESPYPTGPFWDTLPDHASHHIKRTIGSLFTPSELAALTLNPDADGKSKLTQVYDILLADPTTTDDPEALEGDAFSRWRMREWVLAQLEDGLSRPGAAEARLRARLAVAGRRFAAGKDASPHDLGAMNNLAVLLAKQGSEEKLAEAEALVRENTPLLEGAPGLGRTSPQALGNMRLLVDVLMRRGKFDEAERMTAEGYRVIGEMGKGKFAKYEAEEEEAMDAVRAKLETLKAEGSREGSRQL